MKKAKILIVDDHAIFRAGLKMLLNNEKDMYVEDEATNGVEAVEKSAKRNFDVIIMDITMPEMNGISAVKKIKKNNTKSKIIILTMHDDENYVKEFFNMGASGYIVKKAADSELIDAIRTVVNSNCFVYPNFKKILSKKKGKLSPREEEVLIFLAKGFTNKDIANSLDISVKTVETYRARIMEKLNLTSRAELVTYATLKGLVEF